MSGAADVRMATWRGYALDLVLVAAAVCAALYFLIDPVLFDIRTPFMYREGDRLSHAFVVKTIMDVGWYPTHNPFVGAPFGTDLYDYPFSDGLNFLLIRVLALPTRNWVVVANLFFLAGFFLSGATAYLVMRRIGLRSPWAIAGAVLFALLPYHLMRHGHLLLASYAVVPLGVYLAWIAFDGRGTGKPAPWRRVGQALVVLAVGSGGVYYAFFAAVLIGAAGAARAISSRSWREGLTGALLVAGVVATVLVNVSPSLVYRAGHGPNPEVAARLPVESEIYGLRLTQMVLPHGAHRIDAWRRQAERYAATDPLQNENATAALGVAAVFGFVLLLAHGLARLAGGEDRSPAMSRLALLALVAFLLGTLGGAGALFAQYVSSMIRGYNRISVYIGFLSLSGLLLWVQAAVARIPGSSRIPAFAIATAIAVLGALDQTPREYEVPVSKAFKSDRAFVAALESQVPPGTAVLQLPYQPFPESVPVFGMGNYDPLRGYLHSRTLRWSYGAMKGREGDRWLRTLVTYRPLAEQLDLAARSGFGAVYIDRRGFADGGAGVEAELTAALGSAIAQSEDTRLVAWRMAPKGTAPLPLDAMLPPIETPIAFDRQTLPAFVDAISGFSGWEPWGRWTDGAEAKVAFIRPLPRAFTLRIETGMAMLQNAQQDIRVRVGDSERTFRVDTGPTTVDVPFALDGDATTIEFLIPNPVSPFELGASTDRRKLGIGIRSLRVVPATAAPS